MIIDIVILPPKNLRKKIGVKIKKVVDSVPNFFIVDNTKLVPHLSLWHMKTSQDKINRIARELKQSIKGQKPIKIISSKFHAIEKYKGCLEFPMKENKDLVKLQQKVFQKIYPYKTGLMPQFASFLKIKYSKEKLKEIKKYGKSLGFHPHFTMGWLKNKKDIVGVVKKMKVMKFNFQAKEIYICEIDKWWQVRRIVKKIGF